MRADPLTYLRQRSRPVAMLALCLLIWQALATSLIVAETAARAAGNSDVGVICHSDGNSSTPADRGIHEQDCCSLCLSASTPVLPGHVPAARLHLVQVDASLPLRDPPLAISPRTVRAGSSQAPPSFA
jgi:hypothetical protein